MQSNQSRNKINNLEMKSSNAITQHFNRSREPQLINYEDSLTASDSDIDEDFPRIENSQDSSLSHHTGNSITLTDNLQGKLQSINSVGIKKSSDVHFGTKTFYHGPVTIKQFVLTEDENIKKNETDLGISNEAFDEFFTNIQTQMNECTSKSKENVNERQIDKQKPTDANVTEKNELEKKSKALIGLLTILCVIFFIIIVIIGFFSLFDKGNNEEFSSNIEQTTKEFLITTSTQLTTRKPLKIVTRNEWNARNPKTKLIKLNLPVNKVIISHSGVPECVEDCKQRVRIIQENHMVNHSDINFNYLIGGDGNIYEGRGCNYAGAHTQGFNEISLGICFIGNFINKLPNKLQLDAGERLFDELIRLKVLTDDFKIIGTTQVRPYKSPGERFMKYIMENCTRWIGDLN